MIRDDVVLKLKDKRLAAFSVYIPMVPGDSDKPAVEAAKRLEKAGIKSFWDGKRELGKAYASIVTLPKGRTIAWDIYFVYGPDAVWGRTPPKPVYWMHQLAVDDKCLDGTKFRVAVKKELDAMKQTKHLVLLTRDGCTGTVTMKANLDAAVKKLKGWDYEIVDLDKLPKGDPRKGYPTPTLLFAGKDLYGMAPPAPGTDSPG
ncbi:MAG: hypothetical protein IT207_05990 [Fimbriimonadaceae bacterium]|nr:hypothetical protein [Fimbriimonadaceae bacterium]